MKEYKLEELVRVAKRENNILRPYLYVNPLQGKHIPVDPRESIQLFQTMGELLDTKCTTERVLAIGFAETATAIGLAVSEFSETIKYCTHTTREKYDGEKYLYFTESHSHATEQSLLVNEYQNVLDNIDRIVFIEDEVTTGNTIYKLITEFRKEFSDKNLRFGILSILNSMSDDRIAELEREGIFCLYVSRLPHEYRIEEINNYTFSEVKEAKWSTAIVETNEIYARNNFRYLCSKSILELESTSVITQIWNNISFNNIHSIVVLGTEEFMYLPLKVAYEIAKKYPNISVRFHATTRSPILVSEDNNYPLYCRYGLSSEYDDTRKTFIYNLAKYDLGIVITDSATDKDLLYRSLKGALNEAGCEQLSFFRLNYEK